ncbi:hypothetical protein JMJ35_008876 [Cladonia borealis]|uniref:Uncharacterized protein n=1 Tax=Cladonia borealis TaxID=184061 RepID=A0AA39QT00_9LECA|nr:hypothetical protein JMJ35_008876 [Cladonia borealis]
MAQPLSPLSPLSPDRSNRIAPATSERMSPYKSPEKQPFTAQDTENIPFDSPSGPPSSPFVANPGSSPIRLSTLSKRLSPQKRAMEEYQPRQLTEDALRENEGLTRAVRTMEDETTTTTYHTLNDDTTSNVGGPAGYAGMDDTAFSAFSAVPNVDMTRFAQLGQSPIKDTFDSPTKSHRDGAPTPRPTGRNTPSRNRADHDNGYSSPTPRRHKSHDNDTTNLLVDFTGDFTSIARAADRSPTRNGRLSPKKHQSDLSSYASSRRTPSPAKYPLPPSTPAEARHLANLLDFDLPPAPTPRSIPSITARELESMKSAFQSQISSLIATLKGKDAEVSSLKGAVEDAERRVGEALEEIRNERGAKENLQNEKSDWEKREQEMKDVLRSVKEEIVRGDREKDHLLQRVTEAEYRREEAEAKTLEAESKMAGMRARSSPTNPSDTNHTNANTSNEVEAAVTKVAKELHTLYKSKHETKVTALKKSYSDRWEKKVRDLQSKIDELSKENDDLRVGRDATMTGLDHARLLPNSHTENEAQKKDLESTHHLLETQTQKLHQLEDEISTLQSALTAQQNTNASLTSELSASRLETAELIAATEELMLLSQAAAEAAPQQPPLQDARSLSRSTSGSGLKAPGFGGEERKE